MPSTPQEKVSLKEWRKAVWNRPNVVARMHDDKAVIDGDLLLPRSFPRFPRSIVISRLASTL